LSAPEELISGEQMLAALLRLGEKLHRRGVTADIYVFGGAAMVLAFKARPATRDIDAVFEPDSEVTEAAWEVARENRWPRSWLNTQASAYLSRLPDHRRRLILEAPGIRCMAASERHMLAMKVLAARRLQDTADIRFLLHRLGLTTMEEVVSLFREVYPDQMLVDRARLLVEDILAESDAPPDGWRH
jgi:hypothetical protein